MHKRNVPAKIPKLIKAWYGYFHKWWAIHYLLGVGGTISAISVASNPKFLQLVPYSIDILAWVSAVSLALLTFLMPSRRAKAYKMAWRTLLDAANRYEHDKSYTTRNLFDAVNVGENFIEKIDP